MSYKHSGQTWYRVSRFPLQDMPDQTCRDWAWFFQVFPRCPEGMNKEFIRAEILKRCQEEGLVVRDWDEGVRFRMDKDKDKKGNERVFIKVTFLVEEDKTETKELSLKEQAARAGVNLVKLLRKAP